MDLILITFFMAKDIVMKPSNHYTFFNIKTFDSLNKWFKVQTSIWVVTTHIVVLYESLGLETQALIFCRTWQMHLLLFYMI